MKIYVLSENNKIGDFTSEHGLSLFIKQDKNILFDMGQGDNFLQNAKRFNLEIGDVDVAVISHGHYDHGGGLKTFLENNSKSKVYIMDTAFKDYYSTQKDGVIKYIGLDKELKSDRIVRLTSDYVITDGIETMSHIEKKYPLPLTNKTLYVDPNGKVNDDFCHEHNLVLKEDFGFLLIAGCAHNGIKNILEHFKEKYKTYPKVVVGGMHLYSRTGKTESFDEVIKLGEYLLSTGAMFYTGHCTGDEAYCTLKEVMKDKVDNIYTGKIIEL